MQTPCTTWRIRRTCRARVMVVGRCTDMTSDGGIFACRKSGKRI
ncbi:hypothetical protein GWL_19500 [Herbaspirillum sp. GW103]|nr:hypothetical protein GWL_19500 [Herbaspirillum sp. GW103]